MTENTKESVPAKPSRPVLIWIISIFYFFSAAYMILSFSLVYSGKIPLTPQMQQYLASLTALDHIVTIAIACCNLAAAIFLFMLKRHAFHLFTIAFSVGLLMTLYHAMTKGWIQALGSAGLVGAMIGNGISIAVIIYAYRLTARGVLK